MIDGRCWAIALLAASTAGAAPPAERATPAGAAAAEMLVRHAQDLHLSPEAPARAVRRRAALEMARRFAPDDPEVARGLTGLYLTKGDGEKYAEALAVWLAHYPLDYAAGMDWLRARRSELHTAEDRLGFLRSVAEDADAADHLRAEAWAQIAGIRIRQGLWAEAAEAAGAALALDPHHTDALDAQLQVELGEDPPTAAQRTRVMTAKLEGRPSNTGGAMALAHLVQSLGLHEEAVRLYRHAWAVSLREGEPRADVLQALADALLDAGEPARAVERIGEAGDRITRSPYVKFQLIEAHRRLGEIRAAEEVLSRLAPRYEVLEPAGAFDPAAAMEVAWFFLVVHERPERALTYARKAFERRFEHGGSDIIGGPATLLGAAEIAVGETDEGVKRLVPLADEDPFAAAFLAEHQFAAGDADAAHETVREGLALTRAGWAGRRLRDLAETHDVDVPPMHEADDVAGVLEGFDWTRLTVAVKPQAFLTVSLRPVAPSVSTCEPMEIEAVLTNTGDAPVTLGPDAMLPAQMALEVRLGEATFRYADPPDVLWPAPRRLGPDESVRSVTRVSVGPIKELLRQNPLAEARLTVSALPAPRVGDGEVRSGVPGIVVEPVGFRQSSVLARVPEDKRDDPGTVARQALGWIVYDTQRGKLPARMRAARQVAALLDLARRIEVGRVKRPPELAPAVDKAVLLRMLEEVMKDRSPAVRAQAVLAFHGVSLDEGILRHLAPAASDDSALVRMCMAELVGASRAPGAQTLISYLAGDEDELVANMAAAFLEGED